MMKKKIFICLLIIIVSVLAGCGTAKSGTEPTAEESIPGYDPNFVFDTETTDDIQVTSASEETPEELEEAVMETKETESTEAASSENDNKTSAGNAEASSPTQGDAASSTESTKATSPAETAGTESGLTAYEQYNAMSAEQQEAFVNSFDSITEFIAWYNAAKAEFESIHPNIDVGDGTIDLGEIIGGNG